MSIVECRATATAQTLMHVVGFSAFVQEEKRGQHRVWKAPVQGDSFHEHFAASVRQILLKVSGPLVPEINRLLILEN
jgi:hypothetical protein